MKSKGEFWKMLAAMDDDEFIKFAGFLGYTPKPGDETNSEFRTRFIDSIERT